MRVITTQDSSLSIHSLESIDYIPKYGELLNRQYSVVSQLGAGSYSSVWKCHDAHNDCLVAIKIHKYDRNCWDAAILEYQMMRNIDHPHILHPLKKFIHRSPDKIAPAIIRKYYCIVYELCDTNLDNYIGNLNNTLSIELCRHIIWQILGGLHVLHSSEMIHLDIKPDNILLNGNTVKLADFNSAEYTYAATTSIIGTRYYRAPEIILGITHTKAADIWAVGCILFELCTGDILFNPHNYYSYKITRDEDHLTMIIELLGNYPQWMLNGRRGKKYLYRDGTPRHIPYIYDWPIRRVLNEKYKIFDTALINLLENMLAVDPLVRFTTTQCLAHTWFTT